MPGDERDLGICNRTRLPLARFVKGKRKTTLGESYFVSQSSLRGRLVGSLMSWTARSIRLETRPAGVYMEMRNEVPHSEVGTSTGSNRFS